MRLRSSRRHIHESLDNNEDGESQLVREIGDSREGPFEVLEKKQIRLAILKALRRLCPSHRDVVILRDLRLCSISETARILALSEVNVRSRATAWSSANNRESSNYPGFPTRAPEQP